MNKSMALIFAVLFILALGAGQYALEAGCGACGSGCSMKKASACGAGGCGSGCSSGACAHKGLKKAKVEKHDHGSDIRLNPHEATLSTAGLVALRNARVPMTILDARFGKWDDGVRIPGAKSLNVKSTSKQIGRVLRSKRRLVVTYCASLKCPASAKLAKKLRGLGYGNVVEFPYGIKGWKQAGQPTATGTIAD